MDTQELKLSIILEEEVEIVSCQENYWYKLFLQNKRVRSFIQRVVLFLFYIYIFLVSHKDDDHRFKLNIYPLI